MTDNTFNHASRAAFSNLEMLVGGDIEKMEAEGQHWLVRSGKLPVRIITGTEDDFTTAGFILGSVCPDDTIFRTAILPEGWTITKSPHSSYWSTIEDTLGRERASVFYKAAVYDRGAEIHWHSAATYVSRCVTADEDIINDDVWATPQAIADAARDWLECNSAYLNTVEGAADTYVQTKAARFEKLRFFYGGTA